MSARPHSAIPGTSPRHKASTEPSNDPQLFDINQQLHTWTPDLIRGHAMSHLWYRVDSSRLFSRGKKGGYQCLSCHVLVDEIDATSTKMKSACRPSLTVLEEYPPREKLKPIHHWVSGSYRKSQICDFCQKQLRTRTLAFTQRALRCAWCKRVLHEECLRKKKDAWGFCDLGDHRSIVLGPDEILLHPSPDTTLSRQPSKNAAGFSLTADDIAIYDDEKNPDFQSGLASSMSSKEMSRPSSQSSRRNSEPIQRMPSKTRLMSGLDLCIAEEHVIGEQNTLETETVADESLLGEYASVLEKLPQKKKDSFHRNMQKASRLKIRAKQITEGVVDRALTMNCTPCCISIATQRAFACPLLVFVNPKSGGNQGIALMKSLMWYLNPRQVFNIMARDEFGNVIGPKPALKLFKHLPNLRILVCGGDGTIGWVLQALDELNLANLNIPIGTIPLGTGNDMARSLKMGGGYEGESVGKLLKALSTCVSTKLDRWSLSIENVEMPGNDTSMTEAGIPISYTLPLDVCNNYMSFGMDAWAALNFHLARERDPSKFNSRMHNKAYYGIQGAKDIFQHKYKNLHSMIQLECDGVDLTDIIKRKSFEAIAFLNIYSYSAGTRPWGTKSAVDSFDPPRLDDKKVEVVGFSSALALARGVMKLGHAYRLCQCNSAKIRFLAPVPIQVDGEPCMLTPCTLRMEFKNQATMLCRPKGRFSRDLEEGRTSRCFPEQVSLEDCDDDDYDEMDEVESASGRASPYSQIASHGVSHRPSMDDPVLWSENSHRRGTSPTPSPDVYCRSTSPLSRNVSPTISTRKHLQQQRSFSPGSYLKPPSPVHPRSGTPDETRRDYGPVTVEPRPMTAPNSPDMKPKLQGYSRAAEICTAPSIINDVPVYLVPRSLGERIGPPRYLGNHGLDLSSTLQETRPFLESLLNTPFSRKSGWRFVKYTQTEEGEGVFRVLNRTHEQHMCIQEFLTAIRKGVFVCNIAEDPELQLLFDAADTNDPTEFLRCVEDDALSVHASDKTGFTVLHYAALHNLNNILHVCLDQLGLSADFTDMWAPLHYAAQMGHVQACQTLINYSANTESKDAAGLTPFELASAEGHNLYLQLRDKSNGKDFPNETFV